MNFKVMLLILTFTLLGVTGFVVYDESHRSSTNVATSTDSSVDVSAKLATENPLDAALANPKTTGLESGTMTKNEYVLWSPNPVTISGTAQNQSEVRLNIVRASAQGASTLKRSYLIVVSGTAWQKDVPFVEDGSAFPIGRYNIELVSVSGNVLATSSLTVPLVD